MEATKKLNLGGCGESPSPEPEKKVGRRGMVGGGGGPAEEELGAGRGGEASRQRAGRGRGGRRLGRRGLRGWRSPESMKKKADVP